MDEVFLALALVLAGLAAGSLGGLLGVGGGVVLMPVLRFGVGLPPAQAAGTCVVAVFFTTLGGSIRHWRLGHVLPRQILPIILAGAATTALFSWAFCRLAERPRWLDLGMGAVFCMVAFRLVREVWHDLAGRHRRDEPPSTSARALGGGLRQKLAIGAAAGVLPGLLGIGTGAVLVPAFTLLLGATIKTAVGCSLACFSFNALISAVFKAHQGFVVTTVAVPISLGALLGSHVGAIANRRAAPRLVRVLFGLLFCYVAFRFVLSSLTVTT